MLERLDLFNNPHVGVFLSVGEELIFHPPGLTKKEVKQLEKVLQVEAVEMTLGGARVVGCNIVQNSKALLVSDTATSTERRILERTTEKLDLELDYYKGRHNATGNNILVSDKAALVSPRLAPSAVKRIGRTMEVEAHREAVAGVETVGMAGVVTTRGLLVHAKAQPEELALFKERFGVEPKRATVNFGLPLIGAGLVANSKGAICGTSTTGIELGRIEEGLALY